MYTMDRYVLDSTSSLAMTLSDLRKLDCIFIVLVVNFAAHAA